MLHTLKQVSGFVFVAAFSFGCSKEPVTANDLRAAAIAPMHAQPPAVGSPKIVDAPPSPSPSPSHTSTRRPVRLDLTADDVFDRLLTDVDAIQGSRTTRIVGIGPNQIAKPKKKRWYEDSMLRSWQANSEHREYYDMSRYDER